MLKESVRNVKISLGAIGHRMVLGSIPTVLQYNPNQTMDKGGPGVDSNCITQIRQGAQDGPGFDSNPNQTRGTGWSWVRFQLYNPNQTMDEGGSGFHSNCVVCIPQIWPGMNWVLVKIDFPLEKIVIVCCFNVFFDTTNSFFKSGYNGMNGCVSLYLCLNWFQPDLI